MPVEESKHLVCKSCHRDNDANMLFCIHCGAGISPSAEKLRARSGRSNNTCPSCGKTDELNIRYCVFCATPIDPKRRATGRFDKFSWEMELQENPAKLQAANSFKKAVASKTERKVINWLIPGAILAVAAGIALPIVLQPALLNMFVQSQWTPNSLVVYTDTATTQATLKPKNATGLGDYVYYLSNADKHGSILVPNIKDGTYGLRLEAPQHETVFTNVTISNNGATVLGFPKPLSLPKIED